MGDAFVIVGDVAIDYVTMTTSDHKENSGFVKDFRLCSVDASKARPSRKMQYTGMVYPDGFHGQGKQGDEDHYMLQVWGGTADQFLALRQDWKGSGEVRVTRLDVQVTVPLPEDMTLGELKFILDDLPAREWDCRGQQPNITLWSSKGGMETLYLFSRSSPEFLRIYIKEVEGEKLLRVEAEYKREKAEQLWKSYKLRGADALRMALKGTLSKLPAAAGWVVLAAEDVLGADCGERLLREVKDPTLESTMRWLESAAEPAVQRLAATEMRRHVKAFVSRLNDILGEV